MIDILVGHNIDVMATMNPQSVHAVMTSPPYWQLRDYGSIPVTWGDGWVGELGQEKTPQAFIAHLVEVFRAVKRILRDDGVLWVNLGDTYADGSMSNPSDKSTLGGGKDRGAANYTIRRRGVEGFLKKSLIGIPWRFAIAMMDDGWILRQDIIWHKPNSLPESVKDRCVKAHEYIFMFVKSQKYWWNHEAMIEQAITKPELRRTERKKSLCDEGNDQHQGFSSGKFQYTGTRTKRSVWTEPVGRFSGAHFAIWPPRLVRIMVRASCPVDGVVLDPFGGAGSTAIGASQEGRRVICIEINPEYAEIARQRFPQSFLPLFTEHVEDGMPRYG